MNMVFSQSVEDISENARANLEYRDMRFGAPVYIGCPQYEAWKHTDLIIDVVPGRGGMFSLDNGRERRFLTRSRVCRLPQNP